MTTSQELLVDALKFELRFLEHGGYEPSVREPRKELSVFRDSPSCLNYASAERTHPCSECFLINFVPADKRGESIPCHHIPLNPEGETVDSMERQYNQGELEEAVKNWLRATIQRIEQERAKAPQQTAK